MIRKNFLIVFFLVNFSYLILFSAYRQPYGVNGWDFPDQAVDLLKQANIYRYRNFVSWAQVEPTDLPIDSTNYNWWHVYSGALSAQRGNALICYCVWGAPDWAKPDADKLDVLSYSTTKYAEFLTAMLIYSDTLAPGVCEAVDLGNEDAIWGNWPDGSLLDKDPSWYYANILKAGYNAIKAYNPNILVIPNCVWQGAGHFLDELYQLGCKGYFDRISVHSYGSNPDMATEGQQVVHYATVIRYLKYIAEQNNDPNILIWNSEYSYKLSDETLKKNYYQSVLDTSRKSGFVDLTSMYSAYSDGYPSGNYDKGALIYGDDMWNPPINIATTPAYNMYKSYTVSYPTWDPNNREPLPVLTPASSDVSIVNPGFENGTTGWTNVTIDTVFKHSGNASGKGTNTTSIESQFLNVEKGRLYEVMFWLKISASDPKAFHLEIPLVQEGDQWYWPNRYEALVDTRYYPNGWRRVRYMHYTPTSSGFTGRVKLIIRGVGTGTFWVDDVSIKALNMGNATVVHNTTPPGQPTNLKCNGQVNPLNIGDITPELSWIFNDSDIGDVQSAYQIIVANNLSNINNNIGNIWDTSKKIGPLIKVVYSGQSLIPGTTYYWKVRTWDYTDLQGQYSTVATFKVETNYPPNPPSNLMCDNKTNPSNLGNFTPELSWSFSDQNSNDIQSAYQILVSSNLTLLQSDIGSMWNTNKVNSSSNHVIYNGLTLQPLSTYYWKVKVWDSAGTSSSFSTVATFSMAEYVFKPQIYLSTTSLDFGSLEFDQEKSLSFEILNVGKGTMNGTLFSDQEWIKLDPVSFSLGDKSDNNTVTVRVIVNNSILKQKEGRYNGKIIIISDGGNTSVEVIVTATCVLVKPNPYNPNKGLLTFFGSGIVPGETKIKIYTLSGELVKDLSAKTDELVWDGKTENGTPVINGIYLYTYESPKEKGVGKFTIIR